MPRPPELPGMVARREGESKGDKDQKARQGKGWKERGGRRNG